MTNQLQVITFPQPGAPRVIVLDGEPWFFFEDLRNSIHFEGAALGAALSELGERERMIVPLPTAQLDQRRTLVVSAMGMYVLIRRSGAPNAAKLCYWAAQWVADHVEPTIASRDNGASGAASAVISEVAPTAVRRLARLVATRALERPVTEGQMHEF